MNSIMYLATSLQYMPIAAFNSNIINIILPPCLSITNSFRHSKIHLTILDFTDVIKALFSGMAQIGNLIVLPDCKFVNVVKDTKLLL